MVMQRRPWRAANSSSSGVRDIEPSSGFTISHSAPATAGQLRHGMERAHAICTKTLHSCKALLLLLVWHRGALLPALQTRHPTGETVDNSSCIGGLWKSALIDDSKLWLSMTGHCRPLRLPADVRQKWWGEEKISAHLQAGSRQGGTCPLRPRCALASSALRLAGSCSMHAAVCTRLMDVLHYIR